MQANNAPSQGHQPSPSKGDFSRAKMSNHPTLFILRKIEKGTAFERRIDSGSSQLPHL